MQDQRIEDQHQEDRLSGRDHERGVLYLLLDDRMPWTVEEIAREISGSHLDATDAVAELVGAGLVHRHGDFVFPTRAARCADAIGFE